MSKETQNPQVLNPMDLVPSPSLWVNAPKKLDASAHAESGNLNFRE